MRTGKDNRKNSCGYYQNIEVGGNITMTVNHILHGGDYNPEQWLRYPDILEEDLRLMKKPGTSSPMTT